MAEPASCTLKPRGEARHVLRSFKFSHRPICSFSWYGFFVESTWNDPIKQQLRANLETLGQRVGPKTLVVRGYDEHAMANEVVEAAGLFDERFRPISPPALIVSNRPLQSLDDPEALKDAKIISLNISGAEGSLPNLLDSLVEALTDANAMAALEDPKEETRLKRFWGWVARYAELKPTFFGFGINLNAAAAREMSCSLRLRPSPLCAARCVAAVTGLP
jgi:hypothetical protein